jgi:4-amino-4-deoxy-L-arabinose transferase-like glycosyltransferase
MQNAEPQTRTVRLCVVFFVACLLLFMVLDAYQLREPGLHYDEAKEAGLNAMELITGQPVTAFRDATIQIGPLRLPLMVQDYIGALNVALAAPFLAIGGVNVVALRWLSLLTGALTLVMAWRVAWRLGGPLAASATALLLAVNPAFIFWSRQGVFVTNLTALIFMASLLTGLRWWELRRPRDLWLTAFLCGLGVYAKLLFVWAIGAMLVVAGAAWLLEARSSKRQTGSRKREAGKSNRLALTLALALIFFLIPLTPLVIFNLHTSGTLDSVSGNVGQSYYGANNSAYLPNLLTRLGQIFTLLRAEHLGYLGGPFSNAWAPWLLLGLLLLGSLTLGLDAHRLRRRGKETPGSISAPSTTTTLSGRAAPWWYALAPLLLLVVIVALSAFTVSDLFITHYAMLIPLIPVTGGLTFGVIWEWRRGGVDKQGSQGSRERQGVPAPQIFRALALIALVAWAGGDLVTDIRYHRALAATGGHGAHSDAIYALAGHLDKAKFTTPVALDWGLDAQIRFLTAGRVQPTEVFGYDSLGAPDPSYAERINKLLDNPDTLYLAHLPEYTVFRERVNTLADLASKRGLTLRQRATYTERDGTPLIIMYRAEK